MPAGALLGLTALLLSGCSPDDASGPRASSTTASASATAPSISLASKKASYLKPVTLKVADGTFASVQVTTKDGDEPLDGTVSGDGTSWVSGSAPRPSSSYQVTAEVTDSGKRTTSQTLDFTVAKVPDAQKVSFTVTPDDKAKVGIGQPVVVRFLVPIEREAAIEKAMTVVAKTPSGEVVEGSWSWLNDQEVHWRPKEFWTPGTKVTLDMKIAGVKAGKDRYGRKDYTESFTIGASHVTKFDASTRKVKVYRDGKLIDTWPGVAAGPGWRPSGTYIVLGKAKEIQMDSCSARVTCDKKDPDYYDEKEFWATRITNSGTFLHAADWDSQLGQANVSHGCIHLSDKNAENFYDHAVTGDVVIVSKTGRGPQQRIATQDAGLYDWNLSWSKWKAGSALS